MKTTHSQDRPYGAGLAYRYSVHPQVMQYRDEIDLLEISTEDYIIRERRLHGDPDEAKLNEALAHFPCVAHGISGNIGTVAPLSPHYLFSTGKLLHETGMEIFSEHLAFHSVDGNDLTMFLPMPFTEESVQWIAQNYNEMRNQLGRPFALENVTYPFPISGCEYSEPEFFSRIAEETDCTFLLDVTNVFNNAHNHGYDPMEYFDQYPMHRVSQMHLAGGHKTDEGKWEDSHSAPVMAPVWDLFDEALQQARQCEIIILERDSSLQDFETVMEDVRRARQYFYRHRPLVPPNRGETPVFKKTGESPQPNATKFSQLKAWQRILMARITSETFRKEFRENPEAACQKFDLTDSGWIERLTKLDPVEVHKLEDAWNYISKEEAEIEADYQDKEWAAWAEQMAS